MALGREEAEALASRSDFVWHQRFDLGSGVLSPAVHDIEWLLDVAGDPMDLTGMTVLDIGTANGAAAFIAERRGAQEVVAVDVASEERFGFREIADALGSSVRFPTTRCMVDWCISSGLEPEHVATWPDDRAKRAALRVRPVDPEFRQWTPERPISVNPSSPEFDN